MLSFVLSFVHSDQLVEQHQLSIYFDSNNDNP